MKPRNSALCIAAYLALSVVSEGAGAHHGITGQFDLATRFTLEVRIADIDFVNPHSYVHFDVSESDTTERWSCELRGATNLRRSGWDRSMFEAGKLIRVLGSPDRRESNTCYVIEIEFVEDDVALERYAQILTNSSADDRAQTTAWGAPNFSGDWAGPQFIPQEDEKVGILEAPGQGRSFNFQALFREGGLFQGVGSLSGQLTELGQAMLQDYDVNAEAPRFRCEPENIITDLTWDTYINRIEQTQDRIVITYGNTGLLRTIHLDQQEFPSSIAPSRFGYSLGRWEGQTLVVKSRGFEPGLLQYMPSPIRHSAELEIEERFWLDAETGALRRDYSATDPAVFTGTYSGDDLLYLSEVPYSGVNCDLETNRLPDGSRVQ